MPIRVSLNSMWGCVLACVLAMSSPVWADEAEDRWNVIKDSGDAALISQFRENFPGSKFDLDALVILAALIAQSDTGDAPNAGGVKFSEPLAGFGDTLESYSLSQLLTASPAFPPIEGLPDEFWKEKNCANCHQWTQESLCTQATHYTTDENVHRLNIKHPLGRPFKEALKVWAEGGCL